MIMHAQVNMSQDLGHVHAGNARDRDPRLRASEVLFYADERAKKSEKFYTRFIIAYIVSANTR